MAKVLILAVALWAVGAQAQAQQGGKTGAGVVVGDPTGVTLKHWLDDRLAFDAGVGFSGDAVLYGDFLWHVWDLFPQPEKGRLGAYVGLGPRLETQRDPSFGLRTLAGMNYLVQNRPIEIFLDAGPVFDLAPRTGVDVDVGLGVRFYFGGK